TAKLAQLMQEEKKKQQQLQQQQIQKLLDQIPASYSKQKKEFMKIVLPAVHEVYTQLEAEYKRAQKALQNGDDASFIELKKKEYGVESDKKLLKAMKPHPKSIALAQAAIESAWATSRFYEVANNLFGVWSYNKNEPRVKAQGSREGRAIWLRKYEDATQSMMDYYKTLSRGFAYEEFRKVNMRSDDPLEIAQTLTRYSEKGQEYTQLLVQMIEHNGFMRFD
ncbi:MAG: glucosaminidase domain-containing protein, partial [Campylobacterota bacterium]